MQNNEGRAMPPLRIWILLGIVCVVITGALYKVAQVKTERDFKGRMAFVNQRLREAGDRPVILMLGTSLTRSGVDSASKLEAGIERATGTRPVVIKLWRSATPVSTLIEAMPELHFLTPSLLVVEANMLVAEPAGRNWMVGMEQALTDITRFRITTKKYTPDEKGSDELKNRFELYRYSNGLADTTDFKSFRDFAMRMQSRGSRILLVDFPLEPTDRLQGWNRANAEGIARNLAFIQKAVPAQFQAPQLGWDSSYFYDGAHLNKKGAAVFSNWLVQTIANELKEL